jgi:uncharacterized protein
VQILIILISGLLIGFLAEFIFRSLKNKKIIIPSPYSIIMYGLTGPFLYFLYHLKINMLLKIISINIFTTSLEFLVGYWLKNYKKIILWNYSKHKFNYKGIICLRFSIYWLLMALGYYYFILPALLKF